MEVFRGLPASPLDARPAAVTVGSFDGVHRGHARLLRHSAAVARRIRGTAVAITFEPHPRCVIDPRGCPPLLSDPDGKLGRIKRTGVGATVVLEFTRELSGWTADRFVDALVESLGMRRLVMGPGAALGRGREGTAQVLGAIGAERGFSVDVVAPLAASAPRRPWLRRWAATSDAPGECWHEHAGGAQPGERRRARAAAVARGGRGAVGGRGRVRPAPDHRAW